jgi:hypothetical protein
MLTTDEIMGGLKQIPPGPDKDYLMLEYLITVATGFADGLRERKDLRPPVMVEFGALLAAVNELRRSVRRMVR